MSEQQAPPESVEAKVEALAEQYLDELHAGVAPDRQAMVAAHPEIAEPLARRLELVETMFRLAKKVTAPAARVTGEEPLPAPAADGEKTGPAERAARIKCPHCGNCIQLVEPDPQEVTCQNCGSSFQVDPRATTAYPPGGLPKSIGKFEVLELLGRGAFGMVYKARDPELHRTVAIKVPRAGYFDTQEEEERFLREARSTAQLHHSSIVQVHEIGHDKNVPYIVSDYVQGLTLADMLTGGRPGFRESAELVAQIADGLEYAHRAKVVHRDIKPSNVLIDADGRPHITDFGLARREEGEITVTLDGQVLGTPAYMSPEQAAGDRQRIDARSDIYSLGVILYELLTGELPFRGNKRMLLHQVLHDEPRSPRSLNDRIPRDLETICLKAVAKEPGRRYSYAAELAEDLRRYLRGDAIRARPVGKVERTRRWCRRNPVVAALLAAVAVSLSTGTCIATYFAVQADSRAREAVQSEQKALRLADEKDALARIEQDLRKKAEWDAANLKFEQACAVCAAQDANRGMLWLANALLEAERVRASGLERSIRLQLAAWHPAAHVLERALSHEAGVLAAAFSPDGKIVVTASADKTARVWEAATGKEVGPALCHEGAVCAVAFSPDGKTLLTGSADGTARLWEVATGSPACPPLRHETTVNAVAFSVDGKTLATASAKTTRLWEGPRCKPVGVLFRHQGDVKAVAFSPDGKTLLTGCANNTAQLWEVATGKPAGPALHHQGPVGSVAFSSDRKTFLTGSYDGTTQLWETTTGKPVGQPMKHLGSVLAAAFSPDGKIVLTGSNDARARLWEVATGRSACAPLELRDYVSVVAFSPDGKTILTGGWNLKAARLWRIATGPAPGLPLQHQGPVHAVAFSPDGRTALTGSEDNTARLWDAATGKPASPPLRHQRPVNAVAYSPDGKTVLTGSTDNTAQLWDVATGKPAGPPLQHQRRVSVVAYSPDGRTVVTGSDDNSAGLWDVNTGKAVGPPLQHEHDVVAVGFSPDGKLVLTGSRDNIARLWNTATCEAVGPPFKHRGSVEAVAFSPDGSTVLTGDVNGTTQLWAVVTGKLIGQSTHHENSVMAATFSPDGKTVLTGGGDATARLWVPTAGKAVGRPLPHKRSVVAVAFSPDGNIALTGSWDGTAQLWEVGTSKAVGPAFAHDGGVLAVAFSPDGKSVLTGSYDNTARLWHVPASVEGDVERIKLWTQVITGMELDTYDSVRFLDAATWHARRQRLQALGGPPRP